MVHPHRSRGSASGAPFPVDGIIRVLKPLADFSWVVGLLVAFLLYAVLTMLFRRGKEEPVEVPEPAAAPAVTA
jgi:NCS1 family nucleobase:cation symporter-1